MPGQALESYRLCTQSGSALVSKGALMTPREMADSLQKIAKVIHRSRLAATDFRLFPQRSISL